MSYCPKAQADNRRRRIGALLRQDRFLNALVEARGHVARARATAQIPLGTVNRWTQEDAAFRRQYDEVRGAFAEGGECLAGSLESMLISRALGVHPTCAGVPDSGAIIRASKLLRARLEPGPCARGTSGTAAGNARGRLTGLRHQPNTAAAYRMLNTTR